MINVNEGLQIGDRVYAWFSPFKDKQTKKPAEHEFKLTTNTPRCLRLSSDDGTYSIMFCKELIETWYGNVRKV